MRAFKRFWFDSETGEFNWAIVAIVALAAIFFYNVYSANVYVPSNIEMNGKETVQEVGGNSE